MIDNDRSSLIPIRVIFLVSVRFRGRFFFVPSISDCEGEDTRLTGAGYSPNTRRPDRSPGRALRRP